MRPVLRGLHFLIFFCILTTLGKRRPKFVAAKKQQNRVNSDRTGKAAGSRKSVRSGAQGASEGRKPGRPRRVQEPEPEQEGLLRAEVIVLGSFALAVLLFLSNFHLCGFAGDFLRGIQLGLFGLPGYVAPLVLFIGTCFYQANRENRIVLQKTIATAAAFFLLCGFSQMMFGQQPEAGKGIFEYYRFSAASGMGGGLFGGLLFGGIRAFIGSIGAFLVMAVGMIICMVCITQRSFVKAVKRHSDVAYQHAREDMERRRELYAERQEERRRLREEQRVRGVNLGSTKLSASDNEDAVDMPQEGFEAGWDGSNEEDYGKSSEDGGSADLQAGSQAADEASEETPGTSRGRRLFPEEAMEPDLSDIFTGSITMPEDDYDLEAAAKRLTESGFGQFEQAGEVFTGGARRLDEESAVNPAHDQTAQSEHQQEPEQIQDEAPWDEPAKAEHEECTYTRPQDPAWQEAAPEEYLPEPDVAYTVKTEQNTDFAIPEGNKHVVTAGGKVIDTDTEALQKKLESAKKAAAAEKSEEAADSEVAVEQQIREQAEEPKKEYIFPPLSLLKRGGRSSGGYSEQEYRDTAVKLQQTLRNFGVGVTVTNISCGPSVTRYELHPEQGVKVSKIVGLADDIKLSLAAEDIRIEAPIPGKSAVGIEVPNKEKTSVFLRDLLESDAFQKHPSRLAFAVGKDIGGQVVVTDIAKMPHLLIAGATGSGKSVCINTIIMSIIYKADPEDVKLIMVDPKVVELSVYNGIPHLLIPVVTDPKKAAGALNWAVVEMMDRYNKFAASNVRDLKGYNAKVQTLAESGDIPADQIPKKLPQLVIIIDELADLMMVASNEVEDAICRLAQLARAAGIHLVIATQRPSVNVITGVIKANVPSRIAFSVASGVDSRTILDMNGAEKLLGNGDMLFYPSGYPKPLRVQGAFVSDGEVSNVTEFLKEQNTDAGYNTEIEKKLSQSSFGGGAGGQNERDALFTDAGKFIIEKDKASIGMLQRMFKIGFNRAARIMDQLAEAGVVGEEEGTKPRKILMSMEEFEEFLEAGY